MLALSGLHRIELAAGLFGGLLAGGALGLFGLRPTRFAVDPVKGDCHVPNPWIGALLAMLLLCRLAWRFRCSDHRRSTPRLGRRAGSIRCSRWATPPTH